MSVIHPGLFLIMQRFPSQKDNLRRLYRNCPSFHTLCDDYQRCTDALAHWIRSRHDKAQERSREYQELRQSLECEIRECIGTMR